MDLSKFVEESLAKHAENANRLANSSSLRADIVSAANAIIESYKKGGRLFIAGNGGSAADAQHIAAEMVGKLWKDRTPLPAFAMTVDSSLLTAVGNDYSYDEIFSRQVLGLVQKNDVFLGITTSGNSGNILRAFEVCKKIGAVGILLSGKDGGKIKSSNLADICVLATGETTANIQEAHIAIYHTICFMVEGALIESGHIKFF